MNSISSKIEYTSPELDIIELCFDVVTASGDPQPTGGIHLPDV